MQEIKLKCPSQDVAIRLFGINHQFLKLMENNFSVTMSPKGREVLIKGEDKDVNLVYQLLSQIMLLIEKGRVVKKSDIINSISHIKKGGKAKLDKVFDEVALKTDSGKTISPRTINQLNYIRSIKSHDLVFGIGPAGTGKTFLAMAMALSYYKDKKVERIILTRPAVEAGENLGFLPGDLEEKINPYLRPLYDALFEMFHPRRATALLKDTTIEVAPLAFMRGRTLKNAFVILDEAQNTSYEQMKMLLTRIGENSYCVINGDITQIDLPNPARSGLINAVRILKGIKGIKICKFTGEDVVRHHLVQKIIAAYQKFENS
ncbi:MAG: PhoH family protein [Deltaproteobacteria bacterium]|jgi:phosphate starvation-inducible PhoH-like protein|nr:PhoH family protein [Deltaproteobacteria bacterium]